MDENERLTYNAKSLGITLDQAKEIDSLMATPMKDFPPSLQDALSIVFKRVGGSGDVIVDTIAVWIKNDRNADKTIASLFPTAPAATESDGDA